MLWRRQWLPTLVLLPGKFHGRRSLVGCRPWGCEESDTAERLHFHFSPSCIGEGNGNPLQCSCLENPRDGGAWWAAVYGVAQSWTRLKRLSSSSCLVDGLQPTRVPCQGDLTGKNIGVSCHSLLQGLFHHAGIKPRFPALKEDSLPSEPPGKLLAVKFGQIR